MDIQVILAIVKGLFGFLQGSVKNLSPVERRIGALIVLLAFVGVLILISTRCSLSAFLVVMPTTILMAFFIVWMAYRFDQQRKRDAQVIFHTEVNSLEKVVSNARTVIEKLLETVGAEQKGKIEEAKDKLDNHLKTLSSITTEFSIWKEAEIWLRNNQEPLVKITMGKFLEKHPDLKNPGRSLDSDEKTKGFEESINRHIQWVLKVLYLGDDSIPLNESPIILERDAYRDIFDYLKKEVKKQKISPSSPAKEVVLGLLEVLIKHYRN